MHCERAKNGKLALEKFGGKSVRCTRRRFCFELIWGAIAAATQKLRCHKLSPLHRELQDVGGERFTGFHENCVLSGLPLFAQPNQTSPFRSH